MEDNDLIKTIEAILKRGDPNYNETSGAFFELLSKFSAELNLNAFAQACEYYLKVYPESTKVIASSIPGIISNHYFRALPNFDYDKFIQWQLNTNEWGKTLKENFTSLSGLEKSINTIQIALTKSK